MSVPSPNESIEGLSVRPGAASNLPPPPARHRAFGSTLQLLALCPLLAVSDTVVKALGFSTLVLVIFPLATLLLSALRRWLADSIVLPASLLVTAGLVTAAELFMRAWFHDLGASFGVFLPLVAVNIVVIDHIQARDVSRGTALIRSVRIALGIALTLIALGFARELVGRGSLLSGAATLFGNWGEHLEIKVFSVDMGFLLAMLPPGAFISLGLLIAVRNWIASRNPTAS
ncbi:Rnf-Nqr domain containing protein [Peristeroidobacter agariperforans]|uniref:Rnf-Nqr domain containing protein n=1 Tax=Peristeroidobacter agariperforans TaxID=268404 RepID=UPI00101DE6E6|nr:Rnf-Nqr domain containing protein [Peristeroidobacter agariperforans]